MMRVLVTGSAGHLGEALVRTLRDSRHEVVGLDVLDSPYTTDVGSITDRPLVRRCMAGVCAVFHPATLHKPHVATHSRQDFVDVNVTGTLNLLEEAAVAGVDAFVFASTTSVFGDALVPPAGVSAAWVMEDVAPVPKNSRVYVNRRARDELGWQPRYDFKFILDRLAAGDELRSPLARAIGSKGYHADACPDGPYPVE